MAKKRIINTGMVESKWWSLEDNKLNIDWGRDYLKNDIPATILLFRIDRLKTKTNNLYGETRSNEKVTLAPVELIVKLSVDEENTNYLANTPIAKQFAGQLIFTIYEAELEEKEVTINRGDFIGFKNAKGKLTYYVVNDADINNVSNSKTIGGIGAFYRKIVCVSVDSDQFAG